MLGCISSKGLDDLKVINNATVYHPDEPTKKGFIRFAIVQDENHFKTNINRLSGNEGTMRITTKSQFDYLPNDIVMWQGKKYTISRIDNEIKIRGEQSMAVVKENGNVWIYIDLRRAG